MDKKTFNLCIVLLTMLLSMNQLHAQDMKVGLALKGSTMGYGGDVVFQFHEKMTARLGYDQLNLGPFDFNFKESDISYDASATVKTGSITALYDYYIAPKFFVSAGFGLNNFLVNAAGAAGSSLPWGDVEIPAEKVGSFDISLEPGMKISPYLGLGVGRTISSDKLVSFCFEIGSYYMGGPNVSIESTGLIAPTSNPDFGQELVLENQLSQYYLYPVVKLSLGFKLYQF